MYRTRTKDSVDFDMRTKLTKYEIIWRQSIIFSVLIWLCFLKFIVHTYIEPKETKSRFINREGWGTKWSWPILLYYSIICLESLRITTKNLSQAVRLPAENRTRVQTDPVVHKVSSGFIFRGQDELHATIRLHSVQLRHKDRDMR
jgi:hypothetical protein